MKELSSIEAAYIAGIVDGEGSIGIAYTTNRFTLQVSAHNTHEELMDWLADKWDSNKYLHQYRDECWKPIYSVTLSGKRAKELLIAIAPYMIAKRDRAQLVLTFPIGGEEGKPRKLSDEDALQQATIYIQMKALNKRGKTSEDIESIESVEN